jgi:hypothetical protein
MSVYDIRELQHHYHEHLTWEPPVSKPKNTPPRSEKNMLQQGKGALIQEKKRGTRQENYACRNKSGRN